MRCAYERTIFVNEEDRFCIIECSTKDLNVPKEAKKKGTKDRIFFVAAGHNLSLNHSIEMELHGKWEKDRYGVKLKVENCIEIVPQTREGIIGYLSSGLIKGIGRATAEEIVDQFGAKTLEIIEFTPEKLLQIRGITSRKLREISKTYQESRELRDIVSFLAQFDLSVSKALKIHKEFGAQSLDVLQRNPYQLCGISGFGFLTVDAIARKNGCKPDHKQRIEEGLLYLLDNAQGNGGHLYLSKEELLAQAYELLNHGFTQETVSMEKTGSVLTHMILSGQLVSDNDCVYLPYLYGAERRTAERICDLAGETELYPDLNDVLQEAQEKLGIIPAQKQKEAVNMCMENALSIITGGPGTGKTTVLKLILEVYHRLIGKTVMMMAPTSMAANKMSESTGVSGASTIHRALQLRYLEENDEEECQTLEADFIIVDEMSMTDMRLAEKLFLSIKPGTRVLLVGDPDQLPSVGAGNVFRELIDCGKIPVTRLEFVYRQQEGSRITENAERIRKGNCTLQYDDSFRFVPCKTQDQASDLLRSLYLQEVKENGLEEVQIITPVRRNGELSSNSLNRALHDQVNPPAVGKNEARVGARIFRIGDRVQQMENTETVSNGEIGTLTGIEIQDETTVFTIQFSDSREVHYEADDMAKVQFSFAITVHKSQGNEWKTIIIPMMYRFYNMLRRNLIYTAVTRSKSKVILIGERGALMKAIRISDVDKRNTRLSEQIIQMMEQNTGGV